MIRLFGRSLWIAEGGLLAIGFLYGYGLLIATLGGGWVLIVGGHMPNLAWWGYLLAPLGLGLAAVLIELIGTWLLNGFALKGAGQPLWRRLLGLSTLIAALVSFLVFQVVFNIN